MTDVTLPREPTLEIVLSMAQRIFLEPEYTGDVPAPHWEWDETDERICKALARAAYAALVEHLRDKEKALPNDAP